MRAWGDIDCDGDVDAVDALQALRFLAALGVTQAAGCPAIGATLLVGANGPAGEPLEIHHIDVEQGDAAVIIAPNGAVAMVDTGRWTNCSNTVDYVQNLGIDVIDYAFATHYDADHIGCLDDLVDAGISVGIACYDRGGSKDTDTFDDYVAACGAKRQTATKDQAVTLQDGSTPVTLTVVDINGAGVATDEENALGMVLKLTYGAYDQVFAGDLTAESPDIESIVGPEVGDVEVSSVNHHGSKFSSSDAWLDATTPEVGILSVGNNSFGHPTAEALGRWHDHGATVYWTNVGDGVAPDAAFDKVGGSIVIEAMPGIGAGYTVSGMGFTDSHANQ